VRHVVDATSPAIVDMVYFIWHNQSSPCEAGGMREVADAYHPSSEALPLVCSFMAGETLHPILHPILLALHPPALY